MAAIIAGLALLLCISSPAHAATITWDGGGLTTNWSEAANWSTNTLPTAADVAVFDGTSAKPGVINVNTSVAGLQLAPTYAGVLTQAPARTLTIGASGYDQAGATFVGGTAAITVNGTYSLSGGTFTSTSGTLTVTGNFTHLAGNFLHGNGTLRLSGTAATIDVPGNEALNNLTLAAGNVVPKTIAAGDTLTVAGTLTLTDGTLDGGTLSATGNLTQAAGFDGGSATLRIDGAGAQTFTGSAGLNAGQLPALVIDKPAGTLSLVGTIRTARDWTYVGGGLDPGTSTVIFAGTLTVTGSHTLANVDLRAALAKTIAAGDTLTVAGTLTLTDGTLDGGTLSATGNLTQAAGFDGGSATLRIDGAGAQTFTGSAGLNAGQLPALVIDKPAGTLSLVGTIRTARDWTYVGGGLDPGTSTVIFAGTLTVTNPAPLYRVEVRLGTVTLGAPLQLLDRLTVTSGTLDTAGNDLTIGSRVSVVGALDITGANLTAGGDVTFTGSVATAGSTILLVGPAAQTVAPGTNTLNDLVVDNVAGVSLGGDATVDGTLDLVDGILAIGPHTLGIAQPIAGTPTNLLGGPASSMDIVGSAPGIRIPASIPDLLNLHIANPQGVTLDADLVIHGTLSLDGGNLIADPFTVAVASTGSVARTIGHVVGRLQKAIPAGGALAVTFEVGDLVAYAPVDVSWSAVSIGGTLAVATRPGDDSGLSTAGINPAASLNRSWTLDPGGLAADPVEVTLNYQSADLDPAADPAALVAAFGDGSSWVLAPVIARTDTSLTLDWNPGAAVTVVAGMAASDLAVSLGGPATLPVGTTGTYAIGVTNTGPLTAGGATVSLPIPAGAIPGAATPSQGSCMVARGVLFCDLGPLSADATATVVVDLTFGAAGNYDLEATASVSGASDPDQGNNVAGLTVTVSAIPVPTPEPSATPSTPPATPAPSGGLPNTGLGWPAMGSNGAMLALAVSVAFLGALIVAASSSRRSASRRDERHR